MEFLIKERILVLSHNGLNITFKLISENLNLELARKLSIARGIANALKFIHDQDILHYDIRR
jgi:hypothetical protein